MLMAICVIVGVVIGTFYANHFSGNRLNIINSGSNRLNNLLHIIDDQYVDDVNIDSLVDMAIPQILSDLDPHSVYISAEDVQRTQDDLKGSFSGIGVEFVIRQDTIHVQNVVKNGPAQQAGVLAGDKIVSVDGKPFVGKVVTNEEAMRRLKGQKGTKVKIGVMRYGSKAVKYFTITRADIPQKSISAVYMLDENTGYIKIKNFGENTYAELLVALAELSQEGFRKPRDRPARQHGRISRIGCADDKRVPAQEQAHCIYRRKEIAKTGVPQRRQRQLSEHTARSAHQRGVGIGF